MTLKIKESTGFADKHGVEIFDGDIVRIAVSEPFQEIHGAWGDYQVMKRPGGYALLYVRSEKGAQLPLHYTGNWMTSMATDDGSVAFKNILFGGHMPVTCSRFERREPEPYESFEEKSARLRAERAAKP